MNIFNLRTGKSAVEIISRWESKQSDVLIFDSSQREISEYMQAVDKIQQSPKMKGFDKHLKTAMARLKREFEAVLKRQVDNAAESSSVTDWSSVVDSTTCAIRFEYYSAHKKPNENEIEYLRNIAKRMSNCGNLGDCIGAYEIVRKPFLESQLKRSGFQELSFGRSGRRLEGNELKSKIELWAQLSKICVEIFFVGERNFCDMIFQNLGEGDRAAKDECFVRTVQRFAFKLFEFVESVASSNQSYERMGSTFVLYDAFLSVLKVSDKLFGSESGKTIRDNCSRTLSEIEKDLKRMIGDFENAVLNDSRNPDDKGGIHRLTEYVMGQIKLIVSNEKLLTSLIKTSPSLKFGETVIPEEELGHFEFRTILARHLVLITEVLLMNLEQKSGKYEDPSLGDLFVMNNVRYLVQQIEGSSELHETIGDLYLSKLLQKVEQSKSSYKSSTSNKFLACFVEEGLHVTGCFSGPTLSKIALKKRIKDFNDVFDNVKASHTSWIVPDPLIRDEIRSFLSKMLVPEYNKFLGKFRRRGEIKYSAEELQALVSEKLFANSS